MKKALITGITGQDGSYLAEFLLKKGYEVYGLTRRVAIRDQQDRASRINHIWNQLKILPCDITNYGSVFNAIQKIMPDEVYHLAAQSFVAESFIDPHQTLDTNINGTLNVLESLRNLKTNTKFYFAGSSEMFGSSPGPQNEKTTFSPRSTYGISKVMGYFLTKNYRESYNMFACSGMLFNHESPRRGEEFVTKKIIESVKKIKDGKQKDLYLGNLDAKRDWGFAGDYVEAMWLMLQQEKPDDFVIGTGEVHSVKEFCKKSFEKVGLNFEDYVKIDSSFSRPAEVNFLQADFSKAKKILGWEPKTKFDGLIELMLKG